MDRPWPEASIACNGAMCNVQWHGINEYFFYIELGGVGTWPQYHPIAAPQGPWRNQPTKVKVVTFNDLVFLLPFRTMGPRTLVAAAISCHGQHHGLTRAHRTARIELLRRQPAKIVPRCVAAGQRGEVDLWLPRGW